MTHAPKPSSLAPDQTDGLEGIVVAHTQLSHIDGTKGRLIVKGVPVEHLAGEMCFEDAVAHLWAGQVDEDRAEPSLQQVFGKARQSAFSVIPTLLSCRQEPLSRMDRLALGLAALPITPDIPESIQITGAFPVLVSAAARIASGKDPVKPDPSLSTAADFLRMMTGAKPEQWAIDGLNRYLVTILDHGLNASTFTARVVASTRADVKYAVLAALGALSGPLHGGAPGPVLDMLDAVGSPDNAEKWISERLSGGHRLMGFGHRIYRTRDPRADVLKSGLRALAKTERLILAEAVEEAALRGLKAAKPNRQIDTNVEFYTAVLLDALGIDRTLFTPLFAMGRVAGWCAHIAEQKRTGKLIRPSSVYVGPMPDL